MELDSKISGIQEIRKIPLCNKDAIFSRIRDANFSSVGPMLNQLAKGVHSSYEERHSAKSVNELKSFVNKLGSLQNQHKSLQLRMF